MASKHSLEPQLRRAHQIVTQHLEKLDQARSTGHAGAHEPVTTNGKLPVQKAAGNDHKIAAPTIVADGGAATTGMKMPTNGHEPHAEAVVADARKSSVAARRVSPKVMSHTRDVPAGAEAAVSVGDGQTENPAEVATAAEWMRAADEFVTPSPPEEDTEERSPADRRSVAGRGEQRPRRWTKTMTPAALEANRANSKKSTGPETPEGKRKITRNALVHSFFAEQKDHVVASDVEDQLAYDEIVAGLMHTYAPQNFVDTQRLYRLALLYYKRFYVLDRADAGEMKRSLIERRRAVRFAPAPVPPDELIQRDPAALRRRPDGVEFLIGVLEQVLRVITPMEAAEALRMMHTLAAELKPALPVHFYEDLASTRTKESAIAAVTHYIPYLQADAHNLRQDELALDAAMNAISRVPAGKHYDRIMRARRENTREIEKLEWTLAPLRSPFGAKAR
jgi:hypothetical protein